VHDVIFFCAKQSGEHFWNRPYVPLSESNYSPGSGRDEDWPSGEGQLEGL
jgi:hypothetical protein